VDRGEAERETGVYQPELGGRAVCSVQKRLVLGIDPGMTGAAALLGCRPGDERCEVVNVVDLTAPPVVGDMAARADLIIMERQQASPLMGRTGAFNLGRGVGIIEGVVLTRMRPYCALHSPMPALWRGAFGLGGGKEGKAQGAEMVRLLLGHGVDRHDQADAILLAWWGWKRVLEPVLVSAHETQDGW